MIGLHTEYITDEKGKKKAVLVPIDEWGKVMEELEELDDIRAYDAAKSGPSCPVPLDKALADIEKNDIN